MPTPNIFNHLLICVNLYQHAKTQLIPSVYSSDLVNFNVLRPDWQHPISTMPNQKIFVLFLIFMNSYQHGKCDAVSSICSREITDLKILQSD